MAATDTPAERSDSVDPELVDTIQSVTEGDFLVVNDRSRTWEVTDVVERPFNEPADPRESRRVCRLTSGATVFELELTTYPNRHEAALHVRETTNWVHEGQSYDVHDVVILDQQVPWVVVTSGAGKYHFPDPQTAAFGEAAPACGGGNQDAEYRLARVSAVVPAYSGCKNCIRHEKPVEFDTVSCPECHKTLCSGLLQGVGCAAVDGLSIVCPKCGFDGVVDVTVTS